MRTQDGFGMSLVSDSHTVPASLEEWLRGFRSDPEHHDLPREIKDYRNQDKEPRMGLGAPKSLTVGFEYDNLAVSIVV